MYSLQKAGAYIQELFNMIGLQLLAMMGLSAGAAGSTSSQGQQKQGDQAGGVAFQTMLGQLAAGANAGGIVVSANGAAQSIEGAGAASGANGVSGEAANLLSNAVAGTNGIGSDLAAMLKEAGVPANIVQGIINIAAENANGAGLENGAVFANLGNQAGLIIENSSAASLNSQSLNNGVEQAGNLTVIPAPGTEGLGQTITNVIAAYKNQFGNNPVQVNGKPTDPDQPLIIIGDDMGEGVDGTALANGTQVPNSLDLSGISNQTGIVVNPDGGSVLSSEQIAQGAEISGIAKALNNGKGTPAQAKGSGEGQKVSSEEGLKQLPQVTNQEAGAKAGKGLETGLKLPEEILLEEGEIAPLTLAGAKAKKLAKGKTNTVGGGQSSQVGKAAQSGGNSPSGIVQAAQSTREGNIGDALASADTTDKQAKLFDAIAQHRMMNEQMEKFGLRGNATTAQGSNTTDPIVAQQGSSASQMILGSAQAIQGTIDASTHDISVASNMAPGRHTPTMPAAQLGLKITKAIKDGANEFQIRLDPAELGRVDVKIKFSASGKATAHIMAESKETLALLQRDGNVLERALQDAGMKTDQNSLSFSLKEQGRDHSRFENHDGKNSHGLTDDDQDDLAPLSDEDITEAVIASMTMDQGLDIRI